MPLAATPTRTRYASVRAFERSVLTTPLQRTLTQKAKDALERATENATFNFTKRRGIAGEIKQYKEQKGEAERFAQLCQERHASRQAVDGSLLRA